MGNRRRLKPIFRFLYFNCYEFKTYLKDLDKLKLYRKDTVDPLLWRIYFNFEAIFLWLWQQFSRYKRFCYANKIIC